MPAIIAPPPEDGDRFFEMPSAIHDTGGTVVGSEVISEDGIYCPSCGQRQTIPKHPPHNLAQCADCRKLFHWGRIVHTYYVASTIPLHKRP